MQIKQSNISANERPLISFIITYYNLPTEMLTECIEYILALSLRPFEREIIIIDDGSESSPIDSILPYGDQIIYIRQKNGGLSNARNQGMVMAKGLYIQFVDGDDLLLQVPYEHCLDIARYNSPDMVLFDFTHNIIPETVFDDTTPVSGTEYMRRHNIQATACGYLFRQDILGELRFTPGIYHEDEEFTPQLLLRAETVYPTAAKAYFYRKRANSITTKTDIRSRLKRLDDTKNIIYRLNSACHTLPTEERIAMQRRIAQLTMDYIYQTIRQTQSREYVEKQLEELRQKGLFPLPDRNYTAKYNWFRRMTKNSIGLSILMRTLPLIAKER
jgi:glycosyltransferase involved in cell wall biosynthesis